MPRFGPIKRRELVACLRRLGYSDTRQALDKLQAIAQRDASARLRKAAVRQLSRTASSADMFEGSWSGSREEE